MYPNKRTLFGPIAAASLVLTLLIGLSVSAAGTGAGQTLTGRLEITWGDSQSGAAVELYTLHTLDGQEIPLQFGETLPLPSEELVALRGQMVQVSGGYAQNEFQTTQLSSLSGDVSQPDAVTGSQPWVSLLCKFSDYATTEPKSPAYFQDMYRSTYPGMDYHWREQSYDLMNVVGSDATNAWFVLPQPRGYYVYNADADPELEFDFTRATSDCTSVANAEINFGAFVGINMMFNADLDGYAWGGSRSMTLDGVTKTWYTTWEPPWGYADITVISHEMGHGFGLPHSSGAYGATYDNRWDVMSDTWTDCARLDDPTFGCLGQHTISYHKDREGWIGSRQVTVPMYSQQTVTLEQLALPQSGNLLMARVPVNGSSSLYYTVEVRRNAGTGFDVKLPGSAVIIHEVNTGRSRPANVVDVDLNGNTGDAGAQWLPPETFNSPTGNISITIDSFSGSTAVVTICNACGLPTPTPPPTPTPLPTPTPTVPPQPMHAGDLDGSRTLNGSKWTAKVTILVHDTGNNPLAGVTVNGSWSAGANGSGSCITASNGTCTVSKANLSGRTLSVAFTVSNLTKSSYFYQPASNHDPDLPVDSNGTKITVAK